MPCIKVKDIILLHVKYSGGAIYLIYIYIYQYQHKYIYFEIAVLMFRPLQPKV